MQLFWPYIDALQVSLFQFYNLLRERQTNFGLSILILLKEFLWPLQYLMHLHNHLQNFISCLKNEEYYPCF